MVLKSPALPIGQRGFFVKEKQKQRSKKFKKSPADKPDSVSRPRSTASSFIWARRYHRRSALPTLRHRANNPRSPVYVAFQPMGFTHSGHCCPASCALTARFHPYPVPIAIGMGGIVSVALSVSRTATGPRPLGGMVFYVVRTFLPVPRPARNKGDEVAGEVGEPVRAGIG